MAGVLGRIRYFRIGVLAVLLAYASPLYAAGRLTLVPSASVAVGFDDNVFFTQTGQVDDIYTTIAPKLEFKLPFNNARMTLDYIGRYYMYSENSNLNEYLNKLNFAFELFMTRRLILALEDSIDITPIFFSGPEDGVVNLTQSNNASAKLVYMRYLFPTHRVDIKGRITSMDVFKKDGAKVGENYLEWLGGLRLTQELGSPDRTIYADGTYKSRDFESALDINGLPLPDLEQYRIMGGLTWKVSRVGLEFYGGVDFASFDTPQPDAETKTYGAKLAYELSGRSKLELGANKFFTQDLLGNPFDSLRLFLNAEHFLTRRFKLNAYGQQHLFHPIGGGAQDKVLVLGAGMEFLFSPRLSMNANYRLSKNGGDDFPTTDFTNNRIFGGLVYTF